MDSNVQPKAWKRYLKISAWLGYQPEATVETNLQQGYKTLYTRYCQDNGFYFQYNRTSNLCQNVFDGGHDPLRWKYFVYSELLIRSPVLHKDLYTKSLVVEKDNVVGHSSMFYTLLYKHAEYQ
jgi:hypothetical protein